MKRFFRSKLALLGIAMVLLAGAIAVPMVGSITRTHAAAPFRFTHPTVGGRGISAQVKAASIITITQCDTGPLSPTGTPQLKCSMATLDLSTLGSLGLLTADTSGHGTGATIGATTHAQVVGTALKLLGIPVTAHVLSSTASANCVNGKPVLSGKSIFVNLVLGTKAPIKGTMAPNTSVNISLGVVNVHAVLNEKTTTANSITVNALHLIVTGLLGVPIANITLASSHAGVNCGVHK
jgi:hypothetical protein